MANDITIESIPSLDEGDHPTIEIEAVTDDELATVTGGRDYGWDGGGWVNTGGGGLGNGGTLPG